MCNKIGGHSDAFLIGRETNLFAPGVSLQCAARVIREWDFLAQSNEKSVVIEKTPKNVIYSRKIIRIIPRAKFIFMVRNSLDNIASLYRRFRNLEACTSRWIVDNRALIRASSDRSVKVVRYEDLTANPSAELAGMIEFAGLPWQETLLAADSAWRGGKSQHAQERAKQVNDEIKPNVGGWKEILDKRDAAYIREKTSRIAEELRYLHLLDDVIS